MKAFPAYTKEQVRNDISYANLMFMLMTIPPYRSYSDNKKGKRQKKIPNHWSNVGF